MSLEIKGLNSKQEQDSRNSEKQIARSQVRWEISADPAKIDKAAQERIPGAKSLIPREFTPVPHKDAQLNRPRKTTERLESAPLGIPKLNSAGIEREHSNAGTPHAIETIPSMQLAEVFPPKIPLQEELRIINDFLEHDGRRSLCSTEYCPILIDGKLSWAHVPKKLSDEQKKAHEQALRFILGKIDETQILGENEFNPSPTAEANALKNTYDLRVALQENPISKKTIKKNEQLTELWRSTYLSFATPYAEKRVLKKLANDIKVILEAFIDYQISQISCLKKEGLLEKGSVAALPDWNPNIKNRLLQRIYTSGVDDTNLAAVLYREPATVFAISSTQQISLSAFFEMARVECDSYITAVAPLASPPVFAKFIREHSNKAEKHELKKHLKDRNFKLLINRALGEKQKRWQALKDKLPFALIQLGLRGCWLIKQTGHTSPDIDAHKSSLLSQETTFIGYTTVATIIKTHASTITQIREKIPRMGPLVQ